MSVLSFEFLDVPRVRVHSDTTILHHVQVLNTQTSREVACVRVSTLDEGFLF